MDSPEVSVFRKTLLFISRELTDAEVRQLGYVCKDQLTVKQREDIKDALGLFEILEQKGIISEDNFAFLVERMEDLQRNDLKKRLLDIMPDEHSGSSADGSTSPPTSHSEAGPSAGQGSGSDSSKGGVTIHAINSPITSRDSKGNTYNYGSKKSSSAAPAPQPQGRVPKAEYHSSSSAQQSYRQSPLNPATLRTPADFYPHSPKARPAVAGQQGSGDAAPKSPQSKASGFVSKTDKTKRARVNETSILDLPNVMTPRSSGPPSDDKRSPENTPDGSSHMESFSEGDLQTDAPQVSKVKTDDALLIDIQSENPAPVLSRGGGGVCQIASVEDLKDVFSQGVQNPGALVDEIAKSLDFNENGMEEDADVSEIGGQVALRAYQHELAHYPLKTGGNYIICAPTGSGKTLTAASICYEKYVKYQDSPIPGRHFKALFIVNIRHLMQQQKNAFQEYFPDSLAIRTIGEQQPFEHALIKDEPLPVVLTLTAQIFVNALRQKAVNLQDIDMLIFDECHHSDLSHPYNVIMQMYLKEKTALSQGVGEHVGSLPQVIGLSASLGVGRGKMPLNHLLKLCANMDVRDIKRVRKHKKQLDEFVKAPEQDVIIPVDSRVTTKRHFGSLLHEIMDQMEDQLGATERSALPQHGCQPYENRVVESQETAKHGDIILYMYLNAYNRALMLYEDLPVQDCLQTLEEFYNSRSVCENGESTQQEKLCQDLFDRNLEEMKKMAREEGDDSNPKLQELVKLLADQFTQNPSSKGIVLTRMKVATVALCEFIRSSKVIEELPYPVQPERLVGQGPFEDFCMTESEQKMTLESFRQEDGCNVLVATDIAQEGLDMPACNFVIRYNFVSNEIGTVQSKGRARAEGSKCFLIVESPSCNEKRELENRGKVKSMEEAMNELEAMPEEERVKCIKEKQSEIINAMAKAERRQQQRVAQMKVKQIILKCAECKQPVCTSSDLRRKGAGGYVTCVNPEIENQITDVTLERTAKRYRDTQSVCKVKCNCTPNCKNILGTRETFFLSDESPGFSLRAKSFLVHNEHGDDKKLKKWKELAIIEDEDL
ncbi:probable ATP-dependent RNA helicase DHX58 isoform X2 [Patiria miniata]|uniref:RNA helicase n=1 Tax=Patiria miniata TaxID=46514 RepID=A0A913YZE6_PATMI|nr:probable ATP-dependent RNA helicase DHX58 isoform X2 [Patiria miniata]